MLRVQDEWLARGAAMLCLETFLPCNPGRAIDSWNDWNHDGVSNEMNLDD